MLQRATEKDFHGLLWVPVSSKRVSFIEGVAVVVRNAYGGEEHGQGGSRKHSPKNPTDVPQVLELREEVGANGGTKLSEGCANAGASAADHARIDLCRDRHGRDPRQALEGELHDVEREEQSGHLSQLFVGYCQNEVGNRTSKETKKLDTLAGGLRQKPRGKYQRGDHEKATPQHLEDTIRVGATAVRVENRCVVLLQTVLHCVKEEPASGSSHDRPPIR
mmetsp:Transcript_54131/g.127204  ORF Transcript_54131/g.127204 Transcript_54131/m.127204 type:complete len:220 (+) Transcript_54131:510-1169(+)